MKPQNASLRLYGGAAFERCLDEFQEAAHVVQFPNGKHLASMITVANTGSSWYVFHGTGTKVLHGNFGSMMLTIETALNLLTAVYSCQGQGSKCAAGKQGERCFWRVSSHSSGPSS